MFAPDTPPRDAEGYPPMGDMMDHIDHPDHDLPEPGHSPRMEHSTKMAGDVIDFPQTAGQKMDAMGAQASNVSAALEKMIGGRSMNTKNVVPFKGGGGKKVGRPSPTDFDY